MLLDAFATSKGNLLLLLEGSFVGHRGYEKVIEAVECA